jgi:hypothetical protein
MVRSRETSLTKRKLCRLCPRGKTRKGVRRVRMSTITPYSTTSRLRKGPNTFILVIGLQKRCKQGVKNWAIEGEIIL